MSAIISGIISTMRDYGIWGGLAGVSLVLIAQAQVQAQIQAPISEASIPQARITQMTCEADGSFVFIPAGEYRAGSSREQRDYGYQISAQAVASDPAGIAAAQDRLRQQAWFEGEADPEMLSLPEFCIGRHPITQAQYQQFVEATGHRVPGISAAEYQQQGFLVHPYEEVEAYLWAGSEPPPQLAQHPVVLISHGDALAYAEWLGSEDGWSYDLPTAQHWEKAARGVEGSYFPWGDDWQDEATNWGGIDPLGTSAIGDFPLSTSPFDVGEMAGNVFEYTATVITRGDRQVSIMKGCSWDDLPGFCRGAYQHTRPLGSRHILFGFRLVRQSIESE